MTTPSNLFFGPDAVCQASLLQLQLTEGQETFENRVEITPDVTVDCDPDGDVEGNYSTSEGNFLQLRLSPKNESCKWMGLHVKMGPASFVDAAVLGVVFKTQADKTITSKIAIRSGDDDGFSDFFFPKTVVSYAESSVHLDIIEIPKSPELPLTAKWREMVIFPRPDLADINFLDMRIFIA